MLTMVQLNRGVWENVISDSTQKQGISVFCFLNREKRIFNALKTFPN